MTLAERLAAFAAPLEFEDVPAAVVANVRLRALDILGIALAASSSEVAPSVLGALKGWGQGGPCSVVGSTLRTAPPLAALANGALAHGLDFDDTHPISITHASAPWIQPSPCNGSAPVAPRCVRLTRILSPCSMIAWLLRPLMWAMKPSPHASCSFAGSYSPCARGGHCGSGRKRASEPCPTLTSPTRIDAY